MYTGVEEGGLYLKPLKTKKEESATTVDDDRKNNHWERKEEGGDHPLSRRWTLAKKLCIDSRFPEEKKRPVTPHSYKIWGPVFPRNTKKLRDFQLSGKGKKDST